MFVIPMFGLSFEITIILLYLHKQAYLFDSKYLADTWLSIVEQGGGVVDNYALPSRGFEGRQHEHHHSLFYCKESIVQMG